MDTAEREKQDVQPAEEQDAAANAQKDAAYSLGIMKMTQSYGDKDLALQEAITIFRSVSGWKDADEKAEACQSLLEDMRAKKQEAERLAEEKRIAAEQRGKKKKFIIAGVVLGIVLVSVLTKTYFILLLGAMVALFFLYSNIKKK